ncbi:hypothetical protein V6N12_055731 [Hibiscus sabdariffa]|uniref:Uncharacterized protein n=1 Tax=Hibiscus sabdariffa TaxID=183260 RepID=A0ABR2AV95_9ROSI
MDSEMKLEVKVAVDVQVCSRALIFSRIAEFVQLGMACIELPLRMHLGGNLVGNPLKYEGGTVINWGIDPGVVSHGDLCKMVEEAGTIEPLVVLLCFAVEAKGECGFNRTRQVS